MRAPLWLRHTRYNEKTYGFGYKTLMELKPKYEGRKALILGAGPGFKRFGMDDLKFLLTREDRPVVIACDGALPTLAGLDQKPDVVVSIDAHPVVANFYRRSQKILEGVDVVLSTAIHRDVVEEALKAGGKINWVQGFFEDDVEKVKYIDLAKFYRKHVTSVAMGGNVGTTCFIMASAVFECMPIGLMGLEFAWSDETPLADTQYFSQIMKITGEDEKVASSLFEHVRNPIDGKFYVADPVYYTYFVQFREIWEKMSWKARGSTFNLTPQGLLPKILNCMSASNFAELNLRDAAPEPPDERCPHCGQSMPPEVKEA